MELRSREKDNKPIFTKKGTWLIKKPTNIEFQFNRLNEAGNSDHTEFLGSILGVKSIFIAGIHLDDEGRHHCYTTGVAKIYQSKGVQRIISFCAHDPEILNSLFMATSTLLTKVDAARVFEIAPWKEYNHDDLDLDSAEESIVITLFSSNYPFRLGIKTIKRTEAVTEVWLHPVGYDMGKLKDEDMNLINGPLPLATSKRGPDMCNWLHDLDCTAPVTRLKQSEPEYLSLLCDMEAPGIVEKMDRESDVPLPIDCFYQLAKPGIDDAGNIKWELTETTTGWAANIIKAAPHNNSRDALIRNLTQILDDSIPAPVLTSSREVDDSNRAIVATVINPPREVDGSNGAFIATVRNPNYSRDMFDSESSDTRQTTGDIILHNDGGNENILSSTPGRTVFFEEDSDAALPIKSRRKHSRVLDSSVDEDENSLLASPATSIRRDDLDAPQENALAGSAHGDLDDQHDNAQDQSMNTSGDQSLNSTGLNLHIGQQDLISDLDDLNISHKEFNVDEAAVDEMRPHFEVKIKELDKELIKKAARTYGFGDPLEGGNSYRMHGYGRTLTCYISNSTTMIQPTDTLFPTVFKSNFGSVVKYMVLVLELYQDPSKIERLRDEQRKAAARKRAYSEDQNEKSPVPRKRARNESPLPSTSRKEKKSQGTPSPIRNRGYYGSPV